MGRPAHLPEPSQRRQVEAMAGYGVPEADIARVLGIDLKMLRKHYRDELDTGTSSPTPRWPRACSAPPATTPVGDRGDLLAEHPRGLAGSLAERSRSGRRVPDEDHHHGGSAKRQRTVTQAAPFRSPAITAASALPCCERHGRRFIAFRAPNLPG